MLPSVAAESGGPEVRGAIGTLPTYLLTYAPLRYM